MFLLFRIPYLLFGCFDGIGSITAAAKRKGQLLIVRGAGHNNIAETGGRDYWTWLDKAIGGAPASTTRVARAGTRSEP